MDLRKSSKTQGMPEFGKGIVANSSKMMEEPFSRSGTSPIFLRSRIDLSISRRVASRLNRASLLGSIPKIFE